MKTNLPITNNEVRFPEVRFPNGRYMVSRTDLKGTIADVNDTFVTVSGFSRDELIGGSAAVLGQQMNPTRAANGIQSEAVTGIAADAGRTMTEVTRSIASVRRSAVSPSRPTCSRSMPLSKRRAPVRVR